MVKASVSCRVVGRVIVKVSNNYVRVRVRLGLGSARVRISLRLGWRCSSHYNNPADVDTGRHRAQEI